MTIPRPDRLIPAREEILVTLRALAGLVAEALWRTATSVDEETFARESAQLAFWRDVHLHHTRRLLPAVVGDVDESVCRAFTERLIRAVYQEDREDRTADRDHGGVSDAVFRHPAAAPATVDQIDPTERRR